MTIVGDLAQTGAPWGVSSWAELLNRHAPGRWRLAELTVNYRTPTEIMNVAAAVLADAAPGAVAPRSMREGGVAPWAVRATPAKLDGVLAEAVTHELAAIGDGRLAVITPSSAARAVADALVARLSSSVVANRSAPLDGLVAVLGVTDTKGLEFRRVLFRSGPRPRS